jgi:cysteinyl-tRNA synthetase
MTLALYDSATGSVRPFVPLQPGHVGIYQCGATVQGPPHIGHLRPAVVFDVLRRWLIRAGNHVTFIRNVTDIDDKVLTRANEEGEPWWALAARFEREFTAAYDALGVMPPTYEPRATGVVVEMIEFIERLIDRGHAYATPEGNVYFDVRSYPDYGSLTHQKLADLEVGEDADTDEDKRDPHDFALWKAAKPSEPADAQWRTPWGRGRPGWHLECSTMSLRYLGETFDIHGGGLDLRFPHHENEQAQSRAAGYGFTRRWMHNGLVTRAGVKMSKSLGNYWDAAALLSQAGPIALRYALTAAQYRSTLEFSENTLDESRTAWDRIANFVNRAAERLGTASAQEVAATGLPEQFQAAMDDDLNTAGALAVVHDWVRRGNTALAEYDDIEAADALGGVRSMLSVLGMDPLAHPWATQDAAQGRSLAALESLIGRQLEERARARAARDFERADAIRDQLAQAGIRLEDSPAGARWAWDQD